MPSSCVVDTDLMSSPLPIHKSGSVLHYLLKLITLVALRRLKIIQSSQISLPSIIPAEPFHKLFNPHDKPTAFQIKIRNKLF
jgi:hypothetical protein